MIRNKTPPQKANFPNIEVDLVFPDTGTSLVSWSEVGTISSDMLVDGRSD
jgi:hypothetical protein